MSPLGEPKIRRKTIVPSQLGDTGTSPKGKAGTVETATTTAAEATVERVESSVHQATFHVYFASVEVIHLITSTQAVLAVAAPTFFWQATCARFVTSHAAGEQLYACKEKSVSKQSCAGSDSPFGLFKTAVSLAAFNSYNVPGPSRLVPTLDCHYPRGLLPKAILPIALRS